MIKVEKTPTEASCQTTRGMRNGRKDAHTQETQRGTQCATTTTQQQQKQEAGQSKHKTSTRSEETNEKPHHIWN
jgi:hypothetical protein